MKQQDKEKNKTVEGLSPSTSTIEQILEDASFKELVQIKANLYFMFGGDKDDLIQEGMIGLVKAYNSFDNEKGASFKTYADKIVQHEICNAVIKANRKKYSPLNTSCDIDEALSKEKAPSPEDAVVFNDLWNDIINNKGKMFGKLEHEVLLKLVEGKTYKQIANEMQKTPKQIDNAMQRVKAKIKCYII